MSKKIFISHSSKDKTIVDSFCKNILSNALDFSLQEDIIFTSGTGSEIESGANWRNYLKNGILSCDVIFLFITTYYKESEICLNEMGAAWGGDKKVIPLVAPNISRKDLGPLVEVIQNGYMNDGKFICKIISDHLFKLSGKKDINLINESVEAFISESQEHLNKNPKVITREEFEDIQDSLVKSRALYTKTKQKLEKKEQECNEIKKLKDANEVKKIEFEHANKDILEKFEHIASLAKEELDEFPSVIVSLIYYSETGNLIGNRFDNSDMDVIENYKQRDGLFFDGEDYTVNFNYKAFKKIGEYLDDLRKMAEHNESLFELFNTKYNEIPLDFNNLDFWESFINVKITTYRE